MGDSGIVELPTVSGAGRASPATDGPAGVAGVGSAEGDAVDAARGRGTPQGTVRGAGVADVSARMESDMVGRGDSSATSSCTSRFDRPPALASTSSWFAGVRCGASRRTAVRLTRPRSSASRAAGNRRAARATSMRLYAAPSSRPSPCVHQTKSDAQPSRRKRRRPSTSMSTRTRAAVD